MAILIGSSGAGDDLIRKLHDEGVSRSCTTIRQVIERKGAIDEAIAHERMRQNELIEKEMKGLRKKAARRRLIDPLLFFRPEKKGDEYLRRLAHLRANREAIVENQLLALYREKDVLDRLTREYRSELKGYYGELLVMDTLKRLDDSYYVISDVRITRESGHRFDGRMLKSARVDHIVVGRKGVYCIETKHWNTLKNKDNGDKPTPGEQARRASHLLYKYLKYTCGITGLKVMGIVIYTNTMIKGKEDFVRFMRNDEFLAYLEARPDNINAEVIQQIVEALRGRDIRFDDSVREESLKEFIEEEEPASAPEEQQPEDALDVTGEEELSDKVT
ncbi:MAG: Nuclease-related domain protein [Methanocella sp. PtaU1.Bin125]|nr:MAG: Nuclease-related domain protein [Methanocella sp. PtaU1.Bin125]